MLTFLGAMRRSRVPAMCARSLFRFASFNMKPSVCYYKTLNLSSQATHEEVRARIHTRTL